MDANVRRSLPLIATLGIAAGLASMFVPMSFDEGEWLAVTRRMDLGRRLYTDLIDNKSAVVYRIVRTLDHLPGSFSIARGLFFGALIAATVFVATAVARRVDAPEGSESIIGALVGAMVALQSMFVLNTETPLVLLVVSAMLLISIDKPLPASACAAAAVVFDPRAAAFVAALIWFAKERRGVTAAWVVAAGWLVLAGAWIAFVVASPKHRFAILEFNAASRSPAGSWRPDAIVIVAIVALAPAVASAYVFFRGPRRPDGSQRRPASGPIFLAAGLAVIVASIYPFFKYWILILPGAILVASTRGQPRSDKPPPGRLLVAAGFAPLILVSILGSVDEAHLVGRYERVGRALNRVLRSGDSFVAFDPQPFATTFAPRHAVLPWAVLDFVGVKTSHREADLRTIAAAIQRATAIVEDGALSVPEGAIEPRYRAVWQIYHARLARFPCVLRIETVTIRLREDRCPAEAAS